MTKNSSPTPISPDGLWENTRVHGKRLLKQIRLIRSFCKKCGRTVTDYIAPESEWEVVCPHIVHGSVLCYDCFAEAHTRLTGDHVCWHLTTPRGDLE